MPRIVCPNCGAVVELANVARTAAEFCPTPGCDYPLFWAHGKAGEQTDNQPEAMAVRRRPGTRGREIPSPEDCPVCGEPNLITAVFCHRCGADMHPVPVPPPPLPPPPRPERGPAPPVPMPRRSPWSDWRVIATLVVLLVMLEMTASLVLLSRS